MQHRIKLTYKDDKSLEVVIKDSEVSKFFNELNSSQVYIHPDSRCGFWTNLADIRYITTKEEEENGGIQVIKKAECGAEEVPDGEDSAEGGEGSAESC